MSLSYDFRECAKESKPIWGRAEYICYYMMAIGMSEITQKNHLEVYARLRMLDCSTMTAIDNDDGDIWFSLETVKVLIGAKFNTEFESKSKFSSRMLKGLLREIERREAKAIQEVA